MSSTNYAELWNRYDFEPTLSVAEDQPTRCVYADKFSPWTEELCVRVAQNPTVVGVNQAKVLLLDKYMEWRNSVPKRHRTYMGAAHVCIFQVFETAYDRLKVVELSLTPPMLFLPQAPPPPPPAPQIAGIFIGEMEGE